MKQRRNQETPRTNSQARRGKGGAMQKFSACSFHKLLMFGYGRCFAAMLMKKFLGNGQRGRGRRYKNISGKSRPMAM
jgi:hypothetical protein